MLSFSPVGPAFASPFAPQGGCPNCAASASLDRLMQPMLPAAMPTLGMEQSLNQTLMYLVGLLAGLMAQQQLGGLSGGGLANGLSGLSGGGGASGSLGGSSGGAGALGGVGPNVPLGEGAGVQKFIDVAKAQQGDPYVFGATGPDKFDCSGLVYYSLRQAGVDVPRLTAAGYQDRFKDSRVDKANLKPGDLIFFWSPNSRGIPQGKASHVEIYLGNGMSMGTDNPSEGAKIEPVNWDTFIGGARVPQLYR